MTKSSNPEVASPRLRRQIRDEEEKEDPRVQGVPDGAHGDLPRPAEGRREG